MNCNLFLSGIANECRTNKGGIKNIYITNINPKPVVTENKITGFARFPQWYKYNVKKNTANYNSTLNVDLANSINYVETVINAQFNHMETVKKIELEALINSDLYLIIEDANGSFWYFGYNEPVYATSATGQTGTNRTDGNNYTIALTDVSKTWPYEIDKSIMANMGKDYLYINALNDCVVTIQKMYDGPNVTVQYSKDKNNWNVLGSVQLNVGEALYLRGVNNTMGTSDGYNRINITGGNCAIGGNIFSLVYGEDFEAHNTLPLSVYLFNGLFENNNYIVNANNLYIPTIQTYDAYYFNMFRNCVNLESVNYKLFYDNLIYTPEAMTGMFDGCFKLKHAPRINLASTVAFGLNRMFKNCESLNYIEFDCKGL